MPARADQLLERDQLGHRVAQARPVELGHLAGVGGGEGVGSLACLVEQPVDSGLALAVDERLQVPLDPLDFGIRDL